MAMGTAPLLLLAVIGIVVSSDPPLSDHCYTCLITVTGMKAYPESSPDLPMSFIEEFTCNLARNHTKRDIHYQLCQAIIEEIKLNGLQEEIRGLTNQPSTKTANFCKKKLSVPFCNEL
ncbi:hypothetical protein Y032_1004g3361 [Ancylostoma ceylanicum]|nr:hypothetical protein Y032_1004g3361 [Ancylostoma ceylanicum]